MIAELNNYLSLINFALLATIIGFLIHISRLSRTAILDKHEAEKAALNQRIQAPEMQIESDSGPKQLSVESRT